MAPHGRILPGMLVRIRSRLPDQDSYVNVSARIGISALSANPIIDRIEPLKVVLAVAVAVNSNGTLEVLVLTPTGKLGWGYHQFFEDVHAH